MPYLLDTNAAIGLMKGHPGIAAHVRRVGRLQLRLCAIVEAELWFGVAKSVKVAENADRLVRLLAWVPSLLFSGRRHDGSARSAPTSLARVRPLALMTCRSQRSPAPTT